MAKIVDVASVLDAIMLEYKIPSKSELARLLDVTPQLIASWYARNTYREDKLLTAFPDINKNFLLTGEGSVRRNDKEAEEPTYYHQVDMDTLLAQIDQQSRQIATQQDQINRLITIIEKMQA